MNITIQARLCSSTSNQITLKTSFSNVHRHLTELFCFLLIHIFLSGNIPIDVHRFITFNFRHHFARHQPLVNQSENVIYLLRCLRVLFPASRNMSTKQTQPQGYRRAVQVTLCESTSWWFQPFIGGGSWLFYLPRTNRNQTTDS